MSPFENAFCGSNFENVLLKMVNLKMYFFEGETLKMYFLREEFWKILMKDMFFLTHAL